MTDTDFRDETGARDRIREAAETLLELWKEYQEMSQAPEESEGWKDSYSAGERACGVAAALMRLGFRIETHYTLAKTP